MRKNENIGQYDINVRFGDTADALYFRFEDESGEDINLDDFKFFIELRQYNSRVNLLRLGDGLRIENSKMLIWDRQEKVTLPVGSYNYAVKMKEPDNTLTTVLSGVYRVVEEKVNELW